MRIRKFKQRAALALLLPLCMGLLPTRAAAETPEKPAVSAQAAVLMDRDSGAVLFEKNADAPLQAASTTKIMTALLVLAHCDLAEPVTIRPEWTRTEGSSMYLRSGASYTVRDLLYGLLLASGNDAAMALACHAAGDVETFVGWMNEKAAALGMRNTRFMNPHGLPAEGHQATARDMGILGCEAMKNRDFAEIAGCKTATVAGVTLRNHNKLLWQYPGATGVKTGYTKAAGRALVSCAARGDSTLVCVTLNAPDDWADHAALLDWGFASFETLDLAALRWQLPVISGVTDSVTVVPQRGQKLLREKAHAGETRIELPRFVYAPVERDDVAGCLRLYDGEGALLTEVPLVYEAHVPVDGQIPLSMWEKLRWAWYFACRHSNYAVYPYFSLY